MFQFSHFLFSHSCGYISADNQFVNRDIQQSIFLSRSGSSEISGHLPQNYYYAVEGPALLCLCVFKSRAVKQCFHAEYGDYCPEQPLYFYQLALNKSPGSRQRGSVKWQGGGDYLLCSDFPLQQHVRSWNIMRYIYSRKGDCIELLY